MKTIIDTLVPLFDALSKKESVEWIGKVVSWKVQDLTILERCDMGDDYDCDYKCIILIINFKEGYTRKYILWRTPKYLSKRGVGTIFARRYYHVLQKMLTTQFVNVFSNISVTLRVVQMWSPVTIAMQ